MIEDFHFKDGKMMEAGLRGALFLGMGSLMDQKDEDDDDHDHDSFGDDGNTISAKGEWSFFLRSLPNSLWGMKLRKLMEHEVSPWMKDSYSRVRRMRRIDSLRGTRDGIQEGNSRRREGDRERVIGRKLKTGLNSRGVFISYSALSPSLSNCSFPDTVTFFLGSLTNQVRNETEKK